MKTPAASHRLLSDGKLSGPEAEEILENVLAAGRRKKASPIRAILNWAGPALAAAACVLLIVYVRSDPADVRIPEEGDVTPRVLTVTCSPGELAACPVSSTLVFSLSGKRVAGFLSAYAERVGQDAERVFFFTKEDGSAELAAPADTTHSSERTVRLEGSLKPGRYRVHAVLANRAFGREEMVGDAAKPGGAAVQGMARVELVITE